ncbi:hypothetical protein CLV92_102308 [Kineococcus xinjiangensis]|uniref:Sodium:proline symporter n=1 Tax=Kineococcus xinjiangensis TaxID=512762 RepID=A0A2S6IV49_9ACTN|nr:hypothetical protein [Kineococcus xinjiangensis]PPK98155.1 hypothetical protein CLV92_102308 [Kineococcus xinjiangensis]
MATTARDTGVRATGTRSTGATLARGAVGGLAAGAVFAAVTMWFMVSMGQPATMPLMMIAAIVQGQEALAAGTAGPALGVLVHMALSLAFGLVFAAATARIRSNATIAVLGAVYGVLLYVVNFLVLAPLVFPWFGQANQPFEFVVHIVFGVLVAFAVFHRTSAGSRTS